jgi:hypothetical protein
MEAIAHTLPYDLRLVGDGFAPVDRLAKITVPTLALAGGKSQQWAMAAAREVAAAVPESSYRVGPRRHRRGDPPGAAGVLRVISAAGPVRRE